MEYGLWNLHGGFWAGNNPCASGGDRSTGTYTSVNAAGGIETAVFPNVAGSGPCRSTYRGQPEYVAMKPSESVPSMPTRTTPPSGATLPSLHGDLIAQQTAQSGGSTMPVNANASNANSQADLNINPPNKKGKPAKSSRKRGSNIKPDNSLPVQYFNQQYTPMYSMMFGRTPLKRPDTTSDESDDEEDDDNNANDIDTYSNESSNMGNQSPLQRSGGGSSGLSRSGYECGQCDLVADTRPALKKHIGQCHPGPPAADSHLTHAAAAMHNKTAGSCPMPACGFRCLSRNELEVHVARHVADGFQRHLSPSSGKKRSGGGGSSGASAASLQRVRYEREEYRCQICSYSCTIEKAFYKHLKLHSIGLNVPSVKISCVICGKDRPSEVEMNKHMRKHRDNRYFCCDVCIFRTVQLKKLIQHRRMHTGEKPHLCPHCAYRSARRDNLRSHVRRVHKKENLYCDTFSPRGLLVSSDHDAGPASPNGSQQ